MPLVFAQTTTTTVEVQRIVGDPLPLWIWWAAGIAILAFILVGGWYVGRRTKNQR
jgi:hypothetical protein